MPTSREAAATNPAPSPTAQASVDLEALSLETGVPVDVLRTLASISDANNEHMFTAESARRAFAGVELRGPRA